MMKAGVPCCRPSTSSAAATPTRVTKLLNDIRSDVETGTSLSSAVSQAPAVFRQPVLQPGGSRRGRPVFWKQLLDRLAIYMEKTEAIKSKIKSALMYPISVVVVAFVVVTVIMIFVIPGLQGSVHSRSVPTCPRPRCS
jgi:type IV pilus assembly protein PilC